jgi:DNA-binding HxlR family transcriptional regulator
LSRKDHVSKLLNVLKNGRRLKILDALTERPRSVKELQKCLSKRGYQHSRSTISKAYLKPLLDVGLIKREGTKYRLTFYGRNFHDALKEVSFGDLLPIHSCYYEEVVLRELKNKPKLQRTRFDCSSQSLSRVLTRLRRRVKLSPTEKRMFRAIPGTGISARALSGEIGINP